MDGISLLEKEIRAHPYLKIEDHQVVHNTCNALRISEDPGLINEYFRGQIEAEASMIYLVGRYSSLVTRLKDKLNERRAGKAFELGSRDDEGLKWSKQDKEQWILATDPKYATQLDMLHDMEALLKLMYGLRDVVFGRDRKLEQLSINYRREMEADKRTGY